MSHKQPAPRATSRPKRPRASPKSGLIANGKSVRHSARPKAALDNRSHRTPEVQLRSAAATGALMLTVQAGHQAHNLMRVAPTAATNVGRQPRDADY